MTRWEAQPGSELASRPEDQPGDKADKREYQEDDDPDCLAERGGARSGRLDDGIDHQNQKDDTEQAEFNTRFLSPFCVAAVRQANWSNDYLGRRNIGPRSSPPHTWKCRCGTSWRASSPWLLRIR